MTHPYSIFIWQPPLSPTGQGSWIEPVQVYTQEYALYVAGLIHTDTGSVIKVVRYGHNIACYPDVHAVELVEKQIARRIRRVMSLCPSLLLALSTSLYSSNRFRWYSTVTCGVKICSR